MISSGNLTNRVLPAQPSKPKPASTTHQSINQDYLRFSQNFTQRVAYKDPKKGSIVQPAPLVVPATLSRPQTTPAQQQALHSNKDKENKAGNRLGVLQPSVMPTNTAAASKNYPFERPAIIAKGQRPKEDVATTLQAVMHNFDRNRPSSSGSYKYSMPSKTATPHSELAQM